MNAETDQKNRRLLRRLLVIPVVMLGFGYAQVPLYSAFCDYTGFNRGAQRALAAGASMPVGRSVLVQFDANVDPHAPFRFRPMILSRRVYPGALARIEYEIENLSDKRVIGQAVPSYGPAAAGAYFRKIECFCFRQQVLAPHERRRMPVLFLLDDRMPAGIGTVTLSYTLFRVPAADVRVTARSASAGSA